MENIVIPDYTVLRELMHNELKESVKQNNMLRVRELLESGCDVNYEAVDEEGPTSCLHLARTLEMTRELILHGAVVDNARMKGRTPLHCAVLRRKGSSVIRELVMCGANINSKDMLNETPLTLAIGTDQFDIIEELFKYDCAFVENSNMQYRSSMSYQFAWETFRDKGKRLITYKVQQSIFRDNEDFTLIRYKKYPILMNHLKVCMDCLNKLKTILFDGIPLPDILRRIKYCNYRLENFPNNIKKQIQSVPMFGEFFVNYLLESVERFKLYKELDKLRVSTRRTNTNKEIYLNHPCLLEITQFLHNRDIKNLIIAAKNNKFLFEIGLHEY